MEWFSEPIVRQVSSKIGVIESLLGKCDKLVIGGGMVFTFLKARGLNVGRYRRIPSPLCSSVVLNMLLGQLPR